MEPLESLLDCRCGADCPGHVLVDVNSEVLKALHSLYLLTVDGDGAVDRVLQSPEIQDDLLCLCCVDGQVVAMAPAH